MADRFERDLGGGWRVDVQPSGSVLFTPNGYVCAWVEDGLFEYSSLYATKVPAKVLLAFLQAAESTHA